MVKYGGGIKICLNFKFAGGRGTVCSDEAEIWMRQVDRVIEINQWSIDEVFQYIQVKFTGIAVVWY